jgi:hypothetical protein
MSESINDSKNIPPAIQKTLGRITLPFCQEKVPLWLEMVGRHTETATFDLNDLLRDSLYYPACGFDGTPIKHFSGLVHSFVYADYLVKKEDLIRNLRSGSGLRGYRQVLDRDVNRHDVAPPGWYPHIMPPRNSWQHLQHRQEQTELFGHWSVWKREHHFTEKHGPEFVSLLYLGAEMSATYQGLYLRTGIVPRVVALIQPGCMGGEWEYPIEAGSFFKRVVDAHPNGKPEFLLRGTYWKSITGTLSEWPDYQVGVCSIYERSATLWRRSKQANHQKDIYNHSQAAEKGR